MRDLYLRLEAGHADFDVMVKSIYPFSTRKQWKLWFFFFVYFLKAEQLDNHI